MTEYINNKDWNKLHKEFIGQNPFDYIVIDNFFNQETVDNLLKEFPDYNSNIWDAYYNTPLENKKTCNVWNKFPEVTYSVFSYLCGKDFEDILKIITGNNSLKSDLGLHGGGWHAHSKNGKLNIHLDYSLHPKLLLKRNYNLIVYITPDWNTSWGGGLELWSHNKTTNQPNQLVQTIDNTFNRAIIFDTTQNSWHGLPIDLDCPDGVVRQSLAVYYVTPPDINTDPRGRALFAPYGDQKNNNDIIKLIKKRSQQGYQLNE
jgi:hypothetical protein